MRAQLDTSSATAATATGRVLCASLNTDTVDGSSTSVVTATAIELPLQPPASFSFPPPAPRHGFHPDEALALRLAAKEDFQSKWVTRENWRATGFFSFFFLLARVVCGRNFARPHSANVPPHWTKDSSHFGLLFVPPNDSLLLFIC
jgi:hypothetical protein